MKKQDQNEINYYNSITTYGNWVSMVRANASDLLTRLHTIMEILRLAAVKFQKEIPEIMTDVRLKFVIK